MTTAEAAELARRRLGWPPSMGPRIETFVPKALQKLAEYAGKHPTKRRYTFSDPATTTVTLEADGSADLTSLSDAGLLLDLLEYGEITHLDFPGIPLVPDRSTAQGALPGNFDQVFPHFWLVGMRIFTRSGDSNATPLVGDLSFACPQVKAVTALASQLNDELIDQIVLIANASGKPAPNLTVAAG